MLLCVELDPGYVDTIIRRWQKLTGGSALHLASGRGFDHSPTKGGRRCRANRRGTTRSAIASRHTRFAKGQSGNPRGRPCGAKNFTTLLEKALNEAVTVTESGGRRKVSKRQAIVTQLVNRSVTPEFCDQAPLRLRLCGKTNVTTEPASRETAELSEADQKVVEQIRSRFSKGEP